MEEPTITSQETEIEYRWAISQSLFSDLSQKLNLHSSFVYMRDETFKVNSNENSFFRIKNRNGKLSYDRKDWNGNGYEETNYSFESLEEALSYFLKEGKPNIVVEKFRSTHKNNKCEINLDFVMGVGYFLEIESNKEEDNTPYILNLANSLGLSSSNICLPYGEYIEKGIKPEVSSANSTNNLILN